MIFGKNQAKQAKASEIERDRQKNEAEKMSQSIKITDFHQGIEFIQQKIEEEGDAFDPEKYLDILKLRNKDNFTVAHEMVMFWMW